MALSSAACRFCYANDSCDKCLNLEFYALTTRISDIKLGSRIESRRLFKGREFSIEEDTTLLDHAGFKVCLRSSDQLTKGLSMGKNCRFCDILNDGYSACGEKTRSRSHQVYMVEVGATLSLLPYDNLYAHDFRTRDRIEFFTTEGSVIPTAIGERDLVPPFWSDRSKRGILEWLGHTSSPCQLPKRVLDMEAHTEVLSITGNIKLWETGFQPGVYVALSHCWVGRDVLKTTDQSLESHLAGISFSSLSPLFRDAVRVCRFLGIRYLWIDSLCIIQENECDWEEQAAQMASIYENAFFTIAIHDDTENGMIPNPKVHEIRSATQDEAPIYVRNVKAAEFLNPFGLLAWDPNAQPNRVFARGWCFQERLLSPRVLHFMAEEIIFQKEGTVVCQCGNHYGELQDGNLLDWKSVVRRFSQLAITKQWDILPCLAGVAQRVHTKFGRNYVAGLWADNLARWLCWKSVAGLNKISIGHSCIACSPWPIRLPKPPTSSYVVPSFSWAARYGPCEFIDCVWNHKYSQTSHVDVIECVPDPRNPFGRFNRCSITISGNVQECYVFSTVGKSGDARRLSGACDRQQFVYVCDPSVENTIRSKGFGREGYPASVDVWFETVIKCSEQIWFDAVDDIPNDGTKALALELFFAQMAADPKNASIGLVLLEHSPSIYRRIGLFWGKKTFFSGKRSQIKII